MDSFWLLNEERVCQTFPDDKGKVSVVSCNETGSHRDHNIPVKFWATLTGTPFLAGSVEEKPMSSFAGQSTDTLFRQPLVLSTHDALRNRECFVIPRSNLQYTWHSRETSALSTQTRTISWQSLKADSAARSQGSQPNFSLLLLLRLLRCGVWPLLADVRVERLSWPKG